MILSVIVASISQVVLKTSANQEHESFLKEYLNARVICGYGLMIVSTLLTIYAYSGLEFKNGPLLESLGYPIVLVLSYLILKEKLTKRRVIGIVLILLGVLVFYL